MSRTEEYRPILFFLSWFLVLEIVAIAMAYSTDYLDMIPLLAVLLIITVVALAYVTYRAEKAIEEEL